MTKKQYQIYRKTRLDMRRGWEVYGKPDRDADIANRRCNELRQRESNGGDTRPEFEFKVVEVWQ